MFLQLFLYFLSVKSILLRFKMFTSPLITLDFSLFADFYSLLFSAVVCFITVNVLVFAKYYIGFSHKSSYFKLLIIIFVASILLLINTSDIFILILGWDGLGIVSFFLIVYYQDSKRIYSGLFTLFVNRLGDSFMILSIVLLLYISPFTYSWVIVFSNYSHLKFFLLVFLLGTMTKSAIFPFSSWLPAAIAAPTPISALVHSSTLVTAGLYLIIRFSAVVIMFNEFCVFMVVVGLYTSLYAGLSALVEKDLKKLVALSTLRHLGFICTALFSGSLYLAFLHLIAHALFKSLLFISVGEIILLAHHSQDKRMITSSMLTSPHSSLFIVFSFANLVGLPFVSGFYSKDNILELIVNSFSSNLIVMVLYINVFLTFMYSINIFIRTFSFSNLLSYNIITQRDLLSSRFIGLLGLSRVFASRVVFWVFPITSVFFATIIIKLQPFILLLAALIFSIVTSFNPTMISSTISNYFYRILFLTPLLSNFTSSVFISNTSRIFKTLENGGLDYTLNLFPVHISLKVSNLVFLMINNFSVLYILGLYFSLRFLIPLIF